MKTEGKKDISVTFTLGEIEAIWLKSLMQNPIQSEEDTQSKNMRQMFWNALKDVRTI